MPFVGSDLMPPKLVRVLRSFPFKEVGVCQGHSHFQR